MTKAKQLVQHLLELADVKLDGPRPFDIHVKDERFYSRVIADRELGFGESYMDGWWEVQKLDEFVARMMSADLRRSAKVSPAMVQAFLGATFF